MWEVGPLTIALYDDVFALWERTEGVGLDEDADSREGINAYLARNPGMSFVALADGKVVAAVLGGHDGRRGYIHHLAVHPRFRRQNVARTLVQHCLDAFGREGIRKSHIFIFHANAEGADFWKSVGWTARSSLSIMSKDIP